MSYTHDVVSVGRDSILVVGILSFRENHLFSSIGCGSVPFQTGSNDPTIYLLVVLSGRLERQLKS